MAAWDALPGDEHKLVWNETERKFWTDQTRQHERADNEAYKSYRNSITDTKVELGYLTGRRSLLFESQAQLVSRLANVEEELARVSQACDDKVECLNGIEQEYYDGRQARSKNRNFVRETMQRLFTEKRGDDSNAEDLEEVDLERPGSLQAQICQARTNAIVPLQRNVAQGWVDAPVGGDSRMEDLRMEGLEMDRVEQNGDHQPSEVQPYDRTRLVDVVDADDNVIGPLERIKPCNMWVKAIQVFEIRRPVKIRRGRHFNHSHLSDLYRRVEAKGVRWLSCMIQATGEIQTKRCQSCDKRQGAFDDCIIVGGTLFPKCGNCEWNRQGCHGASGDIIDVPNAEGRNRQHRNTGSLQNSPTQRAPQTAEIPPQLHQAPPRRRRGLARRRRPFSSKPLAVLAPRPLQPHPSTKVDTPIEEITPSFTPANIRGRPSSADRPTPTSIRIEPFPEPTELFSEGSLEEITRENLSLRDNGVVYTYPECVQDVPLQKIDERHPYWESKWPNLQNFVNSQLDKWRQRAIAADPNDPKQEKGAFSNGPIERQINRCLQILEFLKDGDISPYQLLGKSFIQSDGSNIYSLSTLFRLSKTMSDLAKFKLDVKPVEWIRQRLHELTILKGSSFNLRRTIDDFYRDPKFTALRYKQGFKNTGRPSGMKTSRHSLGTPHDTPKSLEKCKTMHSLASTPHETAYVDQLPLSDQTVLPLDVDSSSGVSKEMTGYQLHEVQTRLYKSQTNTTQYWYWVEDKKSFKHYISNPVTRDVHNDLADFDVKLEDIAKVAYNTETLRIHIFIFTDVSDSTKKIRGDIMARFDCPQTVQRFVRFCRDTGVNVVEAMIEELDRRWNDMCQEVNDVY